jgi:nucleotide-binding universal stress UspA family protein
MSPTEIKTWIIGIDLGGRSRGALYFSQWLAGASDPTIAVHVLPRWSLPHLRGEPITAVHAAVAGAARELHVAQPSTVKVVEAETAEQGLAEAAAGATALVIGRAARAGEHPRTRLGRVARRLLRALPAPVIVVPPDLSAVGSGPILLATDLDVATTAAIAFARRVAADQRRDLEVVHVGMPRHSDLIDELEPGWVASRDNYRVQVAQSLEHWAERHGLAACRRHLVYGDVTRGIEAVAVGCDPALIVVGSRDLGTAGRIFLGSAASALAGFASRPVAVVPSR